MGRTQSAIALVLLGALIGCEADQAMGPEQPIDGSWAFLGIYTDLEGVVRCWLTAEATISQVGGGVNTVLGTGDRVLDCRVLDESERLEGSTAIQNGRLTGRELYVLFGDCDFIGDYDPTRPDTMKGHGTCSVAFTQVGSIGLIGSWQAERVASP